MLDDLNKVKLETEDFLKEFFEWVKLLSKATKNILEISKSDEKQENKFELFKNELKEDFKKNGLTKEVELKVIQNDPNRALLYCVDIVGQKVPKLEKIIKTNPETYKIYESHNFDEKQINKTNSNQKKWFKNLSEKAGKIFNLSKNNLEKENKFELFKDELKEDFKKNGLTKEVELKVIQNDPNRALLYCVDIVGQKVPKLEEIIKTNPETYKIYESHIFDEKQINKTNSNQKKWTNKKEELLKVDEYGETLAHKQAKEGWVTNVAAIQMLKNSKEEKVSSYFKPDDCLNFAIKSGKRMKNLESIISKSGAASLEYASKVLKGKFPKGEKKIFKDKILLQKYTSIGKNSSYSNKLKTTKTKTRRVNL